MKFYKYKESWSHGKTKKWIYVAIDENETDVSNYFDRLCDEHSWSEHFHGIEYRKVKNPPIEWVEKRIKNFQESIKYKKQLIKELQEHLKEHEKK